jgi:cell division protein FtsB
MAARTAQNSIVRTLRKAGLPALAITVMALFGYYAVMGPNGVLAYGEYKREMAARKAEYAKLDKQRAELRNRVGLLDPRHADPDMVDELVRKDLNVAHPDEVIIPLKK